MIFVPSNVWLEQAQSDIKTACVLRDYAKPLASSNSHSDLHCQIVAKCQQTVEKAVKAITAELYAQGQVKHTIGWSHSIVGCIGAIKGAPAVKDDILYTIQESLKSNESSIDNLMNLVPKKTIPLIKNTEYPYQNSAGTMIAPASPGEFHWTNDVEYFVLLAQTIMDKANALILAMYASP